MLSKLISLVLRPALPYLFGIASLFAAYVIGSNVGYREAEVKYEKAAVEEAARQEEINRDLRERFKIRELVLETQVRQRNADIDRMLEEAAKDPDANNQSLSVDSVRRLNSIR